MKHFRWLSVLMMAVWLLPAFAEPTIHGPGLHETPLMLDDQSEPGGLMEVYNTRGELIVDVSLEDGWLIHELQLYIEPVSDDLFTEESGFPIKKDKVDLSKFPHKWEFEDWETGPPPDARTMIVAFNELFGKEEFQWGIPWKHKRIIAVVLHADIVKLDEDGNVAATSDAWGFGDIPVPGSNHGTAFGYEMAHPKKAHFIDSPVAGLRAITPTFMGKTDESGGLDYFPGEWAEFSIGDHRLGEALLDHKVSPLDLVDQSDTDDPRVVNMARLLQSLDAEASPKDGILITDEVETCLNGAMVDLGYAAFDFSSDAQIEAVIQGTIDECTGIVPLVSVDADVAKANLEKTLDSNMFRKNISRTPELGSSKAKLNVMGVWFPAMKANGELASFLDDTGTTQIGVPYFDEDGNLIRVADQAKPLVITYTDAEPVTGAHDVWGAVSRDDGNTWKRKNLSRMGDRSSFTLADGTPFYGESKKPVFQVKGNKILVAWTSKFAKGGKPRYAINLCDDPATPENETPETGCAVYCKGKVEDGTYECEPDYPYDDAYWTDDIWGVSGPQRSHDYTDEGYPEVGEVPYSAVWVVRGVIVTQAEINKGGWWADKVVGDIVWFKPERLTSGRRDANQVFMGGADGAGFAIAWQEDPGGLRPGEAKGPGPGWGGATTNHKTDIWYSYVTWADFAELDENFVSGGDPEHPVQYDEDGNEVPWTNRPKALVPMSLPVRISDNDTVNTDNLMVELGEDGLPVRDTDGNFTPIVNEDAISDEAYGSHRYGYLLDGLWEWDGSIYYEGQDNSGWTPGAGTLYEFVNQQDAIKRVLITADGRALDGNTGASRPNLFLQTYTKPDGSKSAWAIMAYEETKGMGSGPPDDNGTGEEPQDGSGYDPYAMVPDEGKNAIYHSFDFQNPDLVSAGTILNLPETDEEGNPLYVVEPEYLGSDPIYDGEGNITGYTPIPNPLAGELITDWKGDPQFAYENARRPRFILQSKAAAFGGTKPDGSFKEPDNSGTVLIVLYKEGQEGQGRPSDIMARRFVVKKPDGTIKGGNPWSPANVLPGAQNVSTVIPGTTWINPDRDENAKGDGVKVCDWTQPVEALDMKSGANPYEDARAHRGGIRGDFVIMGYSYTPNWAASRNAHDKYDFYIRRSFDGGATWTTDPALSPEETVVHTDYFFDPEGISGAELNEYGDDISEPTKHYTVETEYAGGGVYEPARNVSLIKNNKVSVIEPRIVAVPGTIKVGGVWTGIDEDKQDPNVFYVAYGTSTNLPFIEKAPEDLFLSFSQDRGNTLVEETWVVNPDSEGNHPGETVTGWFRLAKGDPEQGEVQLRMTPNGERFYACWLEEGEEGSDILFRRLTPPEFPANTLETPVVE